MSVLMQDRQDDDYSGFNDEVDGVRKALEQCAPDLIIDFGKHQGVVTDCVLARFALQL